MLLGVLVSGKGTRFILANTEQLHSKIQDMSDRIRNLEDALQALHSDHTDNPHQPHPLMEAELLGIKSTMGLYSGIQSNAASSSKTVTNKPSRHTDLDQSTRLERDSSEDTIMVADHHSHRAQASIRYYIKAVLKNHTTIIERTSPRKSTSLLRLCV